MNGISRMITRSIICATVIVLACSTGCGSRGRGLQIQKPLYKDESGWTIWSCLPGTEVTDRYSWTVDRLRDEGITLPDNVAPAFDYLLWHNPERFYCFVLKIPEGLTTYWSKASTITMTYACKDHIREATSTEFLITDEHQSIVVHSYEIEGLVPIPNSGYTVYSTPNGNPVIFVKFPLTHTPEKIINCTTNNVRVR
jgi:hypothetical protein